MNEVSMGCKKGIEPPKVYFANTCSAIPRRGCVCCA